MTNELMKIDWKDEAMVKTMRDTVAKGATDEEFKLFCAIAQSTGLNPFLKQIWFIKGNKYQNKKGEWVQPPAQIMTGIDGYRAIANTHPAYDGTEIQTDRDKDGKPTRCTAKVWRKDRKFPAVAEVMFREYYKAGFNGKESVWDKNGTVMIEKVAESLATRRAFPLEVGPIRTFDEMGVDETDLSQEEKDGAIEGERVEEDTRVFYDLGALSDAGAPILDERGKAAAQKYLEANFCQYDDELQVYIAPRKLERLSAIITPKAAALKRLEIRQHNEAVEIGEKAAEIDAAGRIAILNQQLHESAQEA